MGNSAVRATEEIEVRIGDEIRLHVPKIDAMASRKPPWWVKDNVDLLRLGNGHRPRDSQNCTTCAEMTMRAHQHRRRQEPEAPGQTCADLAGPWPEGLDGEKYMLSVVKRSTSVGYVAAVKDKRAIPMKNALIESKIDMHTIRRYHSDKGSESIGQFDEWKKDFLIKKTTTGGYDSAANGQAESCILEME